MFNKFIKRGGLLDTLFNSIENDERVSVFGCGLGEKLNIVRETDKFFLYVVNSESDGENIFEKLVSMGLRVKVLFHNPSPSNLFIQKDMIKILGDAIDGNLDGLIVNPLLLMSSLPSSQHLKTQRLVVKKESSVSLDEVKKRLLLLGFERSEFLDESGQFSVKGDTLDLILNDKYYRMFWDWDILKQIKECDRATLIPVAELDELEIFGNKILDIDFDKLALDIKSSKNDELKKYSEASVNTNNMWYLPYTNNFVSNIYGVSDNICIYFNDTKLTYDNLIQDIKAHNEDIKCGIKEGRYLQSHSSCIISDKIQFPDNVAIVGFQHITNANRLFAPKRVFSFKCMPNISYNKNWDLLSFDILSKPSSASQLLFVKNDTNANQIKAVLERKGIDCNIVSSVSSALSGVNIITKPWGVSCGFVDDNIYVYSSESLFGKHKSVKSLKNVGEAFEIELPKTNDIVVHNVHGVGRCLGVECLKLSDSSRDYVIIEYKAGDKLYLPVENINSISKYIGGDQAPKLNKLGSSDFVKTKEKVKSHLKEMAFSLTELYKSRLDQKGYRYPKHDQMMEDFNNSFEYTETADQLKAIEDIMAEMEDGKVMDRLVCGDVGFGKTEVAMRAAFKTVLGGKQVAFMCPTTILSEQHYNTLLARMKKFGIVIKVLNRFRSKSECQKVFEGVKDGKVDIVVGTHKLLNKNLQFKNLGLLILDEEQKFGVEAKESIKEMRRNVNVLTLSATPIPRTLNMALAGIRDISVIETPPVSRIPTSVQVCEFSDAIVKTALLREIDRGGQALIVYNRVENIYEWASHIKALIGEDVAIGVAHGQMEEKQLENEIFKLYNGETQVLIATTLIENGIDLPNANTLIVIESDKLGLSQLYQLKGRVGRGDRESFAYFTYSKDVLNEDAYKRLEAISQYTAMGSGFKIALRDLEIRGAGNVLGAQQHGHMQKVGYALYIQLLNEAVGEIKGKAISQQNDVRVETLLNAFIPHDYIPSYGARMSAYMKISKIKDVEGLEKAINDFEDAFGTVPEEVENLCKISLIKNLSNCLGASRASIKRNETKLYFDNLERVEKVIKNLEKNQNIVLDLEKMPIITITGEKEENILDKTIKFFKTLD